MILKMNQGTYGDFLTYQESLGMTFITTRLHKTAFQEVDSLKISKSLTKWWRWRTFSARIQNLRCTQLESTLKIILIDVENSSFGYNLTYEIWMSEGRGLVA